MKFQYLIIRVTNEGPEAIGPFRTYGLAKKYWAIMEEAGIFMGDKWISPLRKAFN